MHGMLRIIVALILGGGPSVAAAYFQDPDRSATPAQQYGALVKEYDDANHAFAVAKTDQERQQAVARVDKLPLRFLKLAENAIDTALENLIQEADGSNTPK